MRDRSDDFARKNDTARRDFANLPILDSGLFTGKPDRKEFVARLGLPEATDVLGSALMSETRKLFCAANFLADKKKFEPSDQQLKTVKDLDDDDFPTRERATARLVRTCSLVELTNLRHQLEGLTLEQRHRLDKAVRLKAEETWALFMRDPNRVSLEVSHPKAVAALLMHSPKELKDSLMLSHEFNDFMKGSAPQTFQDYLERLRKLDRFGRYWDWIERAAQGGIAAGTDGTLRNLHEMADWSRSKLVSVAARAWAAELHARLAEADPRRISDAASLDPATRQEHARAFVETYADMVKGQSAPFHREPFVRLTERILNDKTIDNGMYSGVLTSLVDSSLKRDPNLNRLPAEDATIGLLSLLGKVRNLPLARQAEVQRQFDRLSSGYEAKVATIRTPETRINYEELLLRTYVESGQKAKATQMLRRAVRTFDAMTDEQFKKRRGSFERKWKDLIAEIP